MSKMPRILVVAALASVLTVAPRAHADPSAGDVLVARQLANEGIELSQKNDCEGAIAKLQRAEAIHHAPTILLKIGECQQRLGRLVDALSSFDRVAREQLGPTPPRAFVAAQQRAATLIEEIRPKVGMLRVDTTGSRTGVMFRLDGGELKEASLGLERPVDPGSHVIEAMTSDGRRVRRAVDVAEGKSEMVTLELPAAPPPAPVAAVSAPAPPRMRDSSMRTLGWGLTAGGAVGLVASAVFAGLTLSTKSSLDSSCADKTCPPSSQSDDDSAKTTATISGIALGVGVVALGAGVVILVTRKDDRVGSQPAWLRMAIAGGGSF
jgi:hypothetical protein